MDAKSDSILLSALLNDLPSDKQLTAIFPHPNYYNRPYIPHDALLILKFKIEGCSQKEIASKLQKHENYISYWYKKTKLRLIQENVVIDVPAISKLFGLGFQSGKNIRLSDLIKDMPSDNQIKQLYADCGYIRERSKRRLLNQEDLYMVQQVIAGQSHASIARSLNINSNVVHCKFRAIYLRLVLDLKIEVDIPNIFPQQKEGV